MKKIVIAIGALLLLSAPAFAEYSLNPYIGVDLDRNDVTYNDGAEAAVDDSLYGLNAHIGIRPSQNWGAEFGFFRTQEGSKDNVVGTAVDTKVKRYGVNLDAIGYLPISQDKRFEALGIAGLTYSKAEIEVSAPGATASLDDKDLGWRIGGGFQYHITDAVAARALVRYERVDFDDSIDHVITSSVGLSFGF